MEHKRKFVIKVSFENRKLITYISKIHKLSSGYFYSTTKDTGIAKVWKLRKTCQNAIDRITKNIDPTKPWMKTRKLEVLEITDNQTLRNIKLKKLRNEEIQYW